MRAGALTGVSLMTQEYQVEKVETAVTLFLAGGQSRQGVVFLSPLSLYSEGGQTLGELLREPGPFIPFVGDDAGFVLINKAQISYLCYQPTSTGMPVLGTPLEITVTLVNDRQLAGTLVLEAPEGKARLQDFMNSNTAYFALDCGEKVCLVNPAMIVEIAPGHN